MDLKCTKLVRDRVAMQHLYRRATHTRAKTKSKTIYKIK